MDLFFIFVSLAILLGTHGEWFKDFENRLMTGDYFTKEFHMDQWRDWINSGSLQINCSEPDKNEETPRQEAFLKTGWDKRKCSFGFSSSSKTFREAMELLSSLAIIDVFQRRKNTKEHSVTATFDGFVFNFKIKMDQCSQILFVTQHKAMYKKTSKLIDYATLAAMLDKAAKDAYWVEKQKSGHTGQKPTTDVSEIVCATLRVNQNLPKNMRQTSLDSPTINKQLSVGICKLFCA